MQKIIKGLFQEFDFIPFCFVEPMFKEGKKMLKKVLLTKRNEYIFLGIKTQLTIK